jgi:hypothetical protein
MPSRLLQIFGSYDLFGKSVPGAFLIIGLSLILPQQTYQTIELEPTFLNIAALLFLLLLVGLMIGQGVHTIANNFEKIFRWTVQRLNGTLRVLEASGDWTFELSTLKSEPASPDEEYDGLWKKLCRNWRNSTIDWLHRRYWGTYDSLVDHRYLFAKSIEWNYSPESGRWEVNQKAEMYDGFITEYQRLYGTDLRLEVPADIVKRYPLITSRLSSQTEGEFRQFQSIYSFCRSMWVVSFILTGLFSWMIFVPFEGVDRAVFLTSLPSTILPWFPVFTFISAVLFFDAAGDYKRYFVEYLIAGFHANTELSRGGNNGNEKI